MSEKNESFVATSVLIILIDVSEFVKQIAVALSTLAETAAEAAAAATGLTLFSGGSCM